jgi:hypothetical protein
MSGPWHDRIDDELPVRLRDAAAELDPDAEVLERGRSAALSAFRQLQAEGAFTDGTSSRPRRLSRLPWLQRPMRHPVVASILAIAVALGGSAGLAAAASGPGQPFYGLRLAVEQLTLPPAGTSARLQADLDRLGTRLTDASQASQRGDAGAVADAIAAYEQALNDTVGQQDVNAAQRARIQALFDQQVQLLQQLLAGAPASAQPGIAQALAELQAARSNVGPPPASPPANPGSNPGQSNGPASSHGTTPPSPQGTRPPSEPTPVAHPSAQPSHPGRTPGAP